MAMVTGEEARVRDARRAGECAAIVGPVYRSPRVQVRGYLPTDRPAIRKLCCDTGFLGKPIDEVFQDRELFADLFTGAYLDHEPEWAFVAEAEGRLVGYLLGSVHRYFDVLLIRNGFPIAAKMVCKLVTGGYAQHPRSARFVRWLLGCGYHEQPKHPALAAHLHFDLDSGYRGRGLGRRLWEVYEERLLAAGIEQCYGTFFSHPMRRPEWVYVRYGFSVYDRKPTRMFQPEVPNVEVVCMRKELRNGVHTPA